MQLQSSTQNNKLTSLQSNQYSQHSPQQSKILTNQGAVSQRSPKLLKQTSPFGNTLLDREERDLINLANNLTKEQIWDKLEQKRFNQLKQAAVSLQSEMIFQQRCPKCTLMPPCKHYKSPDQILVEVPQLIAQPQFKQHLSPKKREYIIKTVKEQSKQLSSTMQMQGISDFSQDKAITKRLSNDYSELQGFSQHNHDVSIGKFQPSTSEDMLQNVQQMSQLGENNGLTFGSNINSNNQASGADINIPVQSHKDVFITARGNRNQIMNNTVGAPPLGGFRAYSEHQKTGGKHQSNLSQYGANLMNYQTQQQRRQFLKKRQGNGGSPVPEIKPSAAGAFYDSHISEEGPLNTSMIDKQKMRDRTTVRIRTKNNQYVYGEASFTNPLNSTKNVDAQKNGGGAVLNHSLMEQSQQSLQERERLQAMIAKYREEKIQKQIERIEEEKRKMEEERLRNREEELRRKKYNEQLKQKLSEYQQIRQQELQERTEQEKFMIKQLEQKERIRRQYFENQKKNIEGYKEQKRKTDELLLIPQQQSPNNQSSQHQMHFYNQFPAQSQISSQMQQQQPVSSGGMISSAGQNYITSGQGQLEEGAAGNHEQENEDEEYDQYYDETNNQRDKQDSESQQQN